ncbi:MAG: YidC/Oxa1 family membrane protein insertase [bacterium]
MLSFLWITLLYQPLFNALVWIYVNVAGANLGWAVVWLTIFLRIALMPLTIKSEVDAIKRERAQEESLEATKQFSSDIIIRKEEIRRIMRKNKISPWAKVLSLGIQLLILVLLYQVFIGGIEGRRVIATLYDWVDYPGKLNAVFYGFDIGIRHGYVWSSIAALYLFTSILISERTKKWDMRRASFLFLFPLATFGVLWFLPMVKSLFILTSMIFSDIISIILKPFINKKTVKDN